MAHQRYAVLFTDAARRRRFVRCDEDARKAAIFHTWRAAARIADRRNQGQVIPLDDLNNCLIDSGH